MFLLIIYRVFILIFLEQLIHNREMRENEDSAEEDFEDEVVKAIKAEKNKSRDQPPTITCEDLIVDISFSPTRNIIALANIVGDVLLYEYCNEENKLLSTMELHLKACRDIEFDNEGTTLYSTAKVCINIKCF